MFRALTYQLLRAWHFLLVGPRMLLRALSAPFRAVGGLCLGVAAWWSRRESRYLVRGLPSLVVVLGAVYLICAGRLRSDTALADTYLVAADHAEGMNKPEVAALLLERVIQLRPADEKALYRLASVAQQSGDHVRAAVLFRQLAPEEGQGYFDAQLEVGRYYLTHLKSSKDNGRRAEIHLEHALTLKPDSPAVHALLGQMYFGRVLWGLAIEQFDLALEYAVKEQGELPEDLQVIQLLLAKACSFRARSGESPRTQEDLDRAERLAKAAQAHFAARVAAEPKEDVQARIILADAYMFLENFDAANQTLEEGLALNESNEALRSALAQFNVAWSDFLQKKNREETRDERFRLLSTALLLDPNYGPIFDRMLAILTENGETADAAREFLLSNVTNGRSIGLSHLLLGTAAYERQDSTSAAYHLERAFESLRNAPIVVNNLAWFLAFRDPPDLDRALHLIDEALARAPEDPRFLDTRGQIYTKQKRWDEAIADLERALAVEAPAAETHLALADCYEAKGLKDLAGRHRQLGEETTP